MDTIREKATYLNRHSDKILFKRIGLLEFEITGFMPGGLRTIRGELGTNIIAIDPPGGPLISAHQENTWPSTDLGEFNKKWKGMKVVSINFDMTEFHKIIMECEYILEKIKWKVIKNPA
jgi:hypothetical protein